MGIMTNLEILRLFPSHRAHGHTDSGVSSPSPELVVVVTKELYLLIFLVP